MQRLKGKVAVVTGASRNVGQGIAFALGEEGTTVYVTGRSTRDRAPRNPNFPETIEDTAEMVTARGGVGIPVRCDHTVDEQVEALFEKIKQEHGRIDILVNNVWGGYENTDDTYEAPFWEQPLWRWDKMFDAGARAHFTASRFAIPLMLPQHQGLIVMTTYTSPATMEGPTSLVALSKWTINGLVYALAHQLRKHNIAVVGAMPAGGAGWAWGWSRKSLQRMYDALHTAGNLDAFFREHPCPKGGESGEYTGRAIVALATDPNVMEKSGLVRRVADLAWEYGFTDVDARRPSGYGMMEQGMTKAIFEMEFAKNLTKQGDKPCND